MTLDAKLVNELNSMQIELPALLERVEILTMKLKLPVTPWRLFRVNIAPQQIKEPPSLSFFSSPIGPSVFLFSGGFFFSGEDPLTATVGSSYRRAVTRDPRSDDVWTTTLT
ncbi:unnamed protein product [Citrullus colocynthis]|uniref:Uncharacterized protein n=1 Tax=Citrullus colocynthis TaxID=252529 RepID=A0ABP0Z4L4_9ROSI